MSIKVIVAGTVFLGIVSLITYAIAPAQLHADSFVVNSTIDAVDANPGDGRCNDGSGKCTLRAAIMEANAMLGPDSITLPAGTYEISIAGRNESVAATGDLDITDDLTITGVDLANTIIDGGGLDRVFDILNLSTVEIFNLTIRNGAPKSFGGGISNSGLLTLTDCEVSNNNAAGTSNPGGGIYNLASVTLNNIIVSNNTASGAGGGISNLGTAIINNSKVSNNSANVAGGGIQNWGSLTVNSSVVDTNYATGGLSSGGGIYSVATAQLTDSIVINNRATNRYGGGIYNSGTLNLTSSSISDNKASSGGGIYKTGGSLTITAGTISGNTANAAGGIFNSFGGSAMLIDSTISNNIATTGNGGGIENGTTLILINSTVSANMAGGPGVGGGIYTGNIVTVTLTNSTVSGNSGGLGGGIYKASGNVNLQNSIVANSPLGGDCWSVGGIFSLGFNLDSDHTCNLTGAGDISGMDPKVGPLQNNGGPTFTHALLSSSPAIDSGDNASCTAKDQRGVARPQNTDCDIGAYEFGPCGDQNNDGMVDIFDAIIDLQIIVRLFVATPEQQILSDVVRDGEINVFDVILTLQHIVGLTEITECGPVL